MWGAGHGRPSCRVLRSRGRFRLSRAQDVGAALTGARAVPGAFEGELRALRGGAARPGPRRGPSASSPLQGLSRSGSVTQRRFLSQL